MDSTVSLIVKSSHQSQPDYKLECSENCTVLDVKKHLSDGYPLNPPVDSQRIIYLGRLLTDDMKVKDFLRKDSEITVHILHLVCSSVHSQAFTYRPQARSEPSSSFNVPTASSPLNMGSTPTTAHHLIGGTQNFAQQMAIYHQLYAQYLAQYPNFIFPAQIASTVTPTPVPQAAVLQPAAPPDENNVNNNNNNEEQQPPVENVQMNAAGRIDDNDDELGGRRDWLDWFYFVIRTLMLLCIIYFYSSFGRLIVVLGITIILYLYQNRWFSAQPRPNAAEQQNENEAALAQNNEENPEPQGTAETDESNADAETAAEDESSNSTPPLPNEPNIYTRVWIFISKFFLSLIPEPPAVQN